MPSLIDDKGADNYRREYQRSRETIERSLSQGKDMEEKLAGLVTNSDHQKLVEVIGVPTNKSIANDVFSVKCVLDTATAHHKSDFNDLRTRLDKLDLSASSTTKKVNELCERRLEEILEQTNISTAIGEARNAVVARMSSLASSDEVSRMARTLETQVSNAENRLMGQIGGVIQVTDMQRALLTHGVKVETAWAVQTMDIKNDLDRQVQGVKDRLVSMAEEIKSLVELSHQEKVGEVITAVDGLTRLCGDLVAKDLSSLKNGQQDLKLDMARLANGDSLKAAVTSEIRDLIGPICDSVSGSLSRKWLELQESHAEKQRALISSLQAAAAHNEHTIRDLQTQLARERQRVNQVEAKAESDVRQLEDEKERNQAALSDRDEEIEWIRSQSLSAQGRNDTLQEKLDQARARLETQDARVLELEHQVINLAACQNELAKYRLDIMTMEQQRDDALAKVQSHVPNPTPGMTWTQSQSSFDTTGEASKGVDDDRGELSSLFAELSRELQGLCIVQVVGSRHVSVMAAMAIPALCQMGISIRQACANVKAFLDSADKEETYCLLHVARRGSNALPMSQMVCKSWDHKTCCWVAVFEDCDSKRLKFKW